MKFFRKLARKARKALKRLWQAVPDGSVEGVVLGIALNLTEGITRESVA